jgi:hypothetical protein
MTASANPPQISPQGLPEFSISEETKRKIFSCYIECLKQACDVFRVDLFDLEYSERELDIRAMFARRSVTHGIAPGKIAGIVAFRLSRFKIVHMKESGWGNANMHMVQELAALFLARRLFAYGKPCSEKGLLELAYQLSRRHANQETLGVFFDIFAEAA